MGRMKILAAFLLNFGARLFRYTNWRKFDKPKRMSLLYYITLFSFQVGINSEFKINKGKEGVVSVCVWMARNYVLAITSFFSQA
jgi:uncharacterized membrane protein